MVNQKQDFKKSIWYYRLKEVSDSIQNRVDKLIRQGTAIDYIGVGASGDKTLKVDFEAELEIIDFCKKLPVSSTLISEEVGRKEFQPKTSKSTDIKQKHIWVIADPIDGSKNFKRGIPFYNTSIAIAEGSTLDSVNAGIVRNLVSNTEYFVEKNFGAYKNQEKAIPNNIKSIENTVIGLNLSNRDFELDSKLNSVIRQVNKIRNMGAVAEEICFVATGATDLFIYLDNRLRLLDIAAAKLFVEESGCIITNEKGESLVEEIKLSNRIKIITTANQDLFDFIAKFLL